MVQDEDFDWSGLRFEAQTELVCEILLKRRVGGRAAGRRSVNVCGGVLEGKVVDARETGPIDNRAVQVACLRQVGGKQTHGDISRTFPRTIRTVPR